MRTLVVESWRAFPLSLSVINQYQCLELLKRRDIRLHHVDLPPPPGKTLKLGREWRQQKGLHPPADEAALGAIPPPRPGAVPDATYRLAMPYDFRPAEHGRTVVFAVTEMGLLKRRLIAGNKRLVQALEGSDAVIVTPSRWSAEGLSNSGADPDRIALVPHGVDTDTYRPPTADERARLRRDLKLEGCFAFLNAGSLYPHKGTALLLKAFAAVAAEHDRARLLIKGTDAVYASRPFLRRFGRQLSQAERDLVAPRLKYFGETLSFADMAKLFRAADAYVAPYHAEGFNMPVLDAMACGLPVICTAGGATDDFVRDDFALRIPGRIRSAPDGEGYWLWPDLDRLIEHMLRLVGDEEFAGRARTAGPAAVREAHGWRQVTDRLVDVLFPPADSGHAWARIPDAAVPPAAHHPSGIETSPAREMAAQRRWRLRPEFAGSDRFDMLVFNEFLPPKHQQEKAAKAVSRIVGYAAEQVPYYRDLMAGLGLSTKDIRGPRDLPNLPLLTKRMVQEHAAELTAPTLPRGDKLLGQTSSSGTTGRPARVAQTVRNNAMYGILVQRHHRVFRFDPAGRLATIRLPSQIPRERDGATLPEGAIRRLPGWMYMSRYFETGPHQMFGMLNPVETQIDWLRRYQPHYLAGYSTSLEHLAFACEGRSPLTELRALHAISDQLTPSMRRRIEGTFGVPVHQNYGLNEIGLVAVRCAAGRYHVHTEHCVVEIVDPEGRPCAPGERGRIAVTALSNAAMPLIRYDSGDLAEALSGPCPCGRTLPAFGDIAGRYNRMAFLPEGTLRYLGTVRDALEAMPADLARRLRRFQLHQYRDGRFELRLLGTAAVADGFKQRIRRAWREVGDRQPALDIVDVDRLDAGPGGKFQDFTSDFMPDPDDDADGPD